MTETPLTREAMLLDAVTAIENSKRRIAVIVDDDHHVLGTLTDGDIRRGLLRGLTLEDPAMDAMNGSPLVIKSPWRDEEVVSAFKARNVLSAPVVDAGERFVRVLHLTDLGYTAETGNAESPIPVAVVMAGGEGRRLRPLTENLPKPLVEVGDMPVLERHIRQLKTSGVRQVYIAVNYLAEMIETHFGDGSDIGISIDYLREDRPLGTAGPLSLATSSTDNGVIVSNGDLVTGCNFRTLAQFHLDEGAALTVAAVEHVVKIPFGVLQVKDSGRVSGVEEKPSQRFLCNAGIYVVSPVAAALVPKEQSFDMTDLVDACVARGVKVAAFPLHEFWSEIGTLDDLERVRSLFGQRNNHNG